MKGNVFLSSLLLFCLLAGLVYADEQELQPSALYAESAVLMDGYTGRVLYGKNPHKKMPMASTTKIMTCILALERGEEDTICEWSLQAAGAPKVKLGASVGCSFYLKDLLYSMMLESHNDSSIAVAESIGGSVEGFARIMNEKAKKIGLEDTSFVTPNGLDADRHYTTAADLARLLMYCIKESPKRKEFLTITQTFQYTFSECKGKGVYTVTNHNALLQRMNGAVTGKTGYTGKAGYCYVGAVEREGVLLIGSLLACGWPNHRNYKWNDMEKLMEYGFTTYQRKTISFFGPSRHSILVENGIYDWKQDESEAIVQVYCDIPAQEEWLLKEEEHLTRIVCIDKEMKAPLQAGTIVGNVSYYIGDFCMAKYPILVKETVHKRDWRWYLQEVITCFQLF